MSSGVMAKSSVVMPQLPLVPIQPLQLTACSAASVLPGSPPSHRNSSPALINMDDDASGSSNFGAENDSHNGQQPQQSFCLKWNNYQSNVTTTFKELLAEEDFVDITLTADGGALKAHKVVLSACSPYFRDILRGISAWQHPVIVLKDVPYSDLQGIVEFIYHGEVSVFQESLTSFLRTAQILRVKGLTEETGSDKQSTNSLDNNSSVKLSSNKRSHSHIRKNARPTRARVGSSKRSHASNSFLGQDASNNNSDEEVMEVSTHQQTLTVHPSPFNNLPSPSKRPFLLRPNNLSSQVTEDDIGDDLDDEEEEAEIDDVEDAEAEERGTLKNMNGSDEEEEEAEMSDPTVLSNPGAILNVSAVADALANNPAEAAKMLEQHQQLDKRQRQQFLMQGGDILQAGLDPDFLPVGIPQLGKLSNINTTSNDANSKASSINGNTSAATIAAMANAMVAAAQANANAAAANAGIVAIQQQNQKAAAAAALVSAASSTTGSGIVNTLPGEPDPNDPNSSSQKKTCPYCCQQLSWHALSRHIRDMHRARTGLVTCKYCHKMFRNKNSLGCHMWRFHKDMREKDQAGSSTSSSAKSISKPFSMALQTARMISSNSESSNHSLNTLKEISGLKKSIDGHVLTNNDNDKIKENSMNDSSSPGSSFQKDEINQLKTSAPSSTIPLTSSAIAVANYCKKAAQAYGNILPPLIIPDPLVRPMVTKNSDLSETTSLPAKKQPSTSAQSGPASPVLCNGSKGPTNDKPEPSTNNGKERIMCPVCRTIVVRRVYRRHYETMHCVQAPVTCQFCLKVFKHRYSLDCHQRQTHPLQRITGRSPSLVSMTPPKPITENDKTETNDGEKSNVSTTIQESDSGTATKSIPEPFPVESHSNTITLKKTRKRKSTNAKDAELQNTCN